MENKLEQSFLSGDFDAANNSVVWRFESSREAKDFADKGLNRIVEALQMHQATTAILDDGESTTCIPLKTVELFIEMQPIYWSDIGIAK